MKRYIVSILIILTGTLTTYAQQSKYQTYTSKMSLIGIKNTEKIQFDNNNITVQLDYKTGEFISRLKNTDFRLKDSFYENNGVKTDERELILKGILPINDIINQKSKVANYKTELQLIDGDEIYHINYDLQIQKPGGGNANYRIFLMKGTIYNDETQFPAFEGFENEISMILSFNAFWK